MRKVVVTGLGAVTPLGNSVNETWEGIKAGKSGIGLITKFDTTDYACKIAGELKDFDPTNYMDKKDARKMGLYSQYAVAAAKMAGKASGAVAASVRSGFDPGQLGDFCSGRPVPVGYLPARHVRLCRGSPV